ncbi:hypothetical protein B0A48_09012 [Cryoendolithus antarcticus]|uniref:Uncharacterized protein n=1 Tax=Cryoendolithus antarcticus TaxID=1507870 RepID=A0A1V8T1E5_9PEZI|nr:hypothetical protein B0A48_09012 [Cryoendolithus antarcticus]
MSLSLVVFSLSPAGSSNVSNDARNPFDFRIALATLDIDLTTVTNDNPDTKATRRTLYVDDALEICALGDALHLRLPHTVNEAEADNDLCYVFHTSDVLDPSVKAKLIRRTGTLPGNGIFLDLYLSPPIVHRATVVSLGGAQIKKAFSQLTTRLGMLGVKP